MTVQLTVIGLDQVGVSFGLALADHKDTILRCGHDPVPSLNKKNDANDQQSLDEMLLERKADHAEWLDQRSDGDWEEANRAKIEKPAGGFRRLFGDPSRLIKK